MTDNLRLLRRDGIDDSGLVDTIADLINEMNDEEQEIANGEGWRGWPDLYEKRIRVTETAPDPDDPSTFLRPPRMETEV